MVKIAVGSELDEGVTIERLPDGSYEVEDQDGDTWMVSSQIPSAALLEIVADRNRVRTALPTAAHFAGGPITAIT